MNPFTDKDQPFFLVVLISIFGWTFNNYVDSLRVDTTLFVSRTETKSSTCRIETFSFENLSSKNGIENLNVVIAAESKPPSAIKYCDGDDSAKDVKAKCLTFAPNTTAPIPNIMDVNVVFPTIYPELSCSIAISVTKDFPSLRFLLASPRTAFQPEAKEAAQYTKLVVDAIRIVEENSIEIWMIRYARMIYLALMLGVLAVTMFWLVASVIKSVFFNKTSTAKGP
jgi:hypothetical protein